ncbi:MAG: thiamine-phosphate kinase [Halobacteriaceae archaeon]
MDEQAALALVAEAVPGTGDDAAIIDDLVVTTDMLHETTDFPPGTTRYTAGWRAVGASLSDIAAMGATATAAVAVYAAPSFDEATLSAFLDGATAVCGTVDAAYVGGDLDTHQEFTVATTAIGETTAPVSRAGATPGDKLCVTGSLGRSAAAVRFFETDPEQANDLFRFTPRVEAGVALADYATAMMDSSDGLARSVHQLCAASDCGVAIDSDRVPVTPALHTVLEDDVINEALTFGEDFELVAAVPHDAVEPAREAVPDLSVVGEFVADGITIDGTPLPDTGYTHGRSDS